ncbi:MAG: methyltransferase domain-containing protein [Myxococcales bacterium]|nr:methyltransferase domain-containing protein [Myxococcales bacterium]
MTQGDPQLQPGDLEAASELCAIVQTADLFEYLGVSAEAEHEELLLALTRKRRRLQGMQGNPKFRESASFLIKNYRRLQRVLHHPDAHVRSMRSAREEEHVAMLHLALGGVLADGRLTVEEEAFLRQAAIQLGISEPRYEQELLASVADGDIVVEALLQPSAGDAQQLFPSPQAARAARLQGAGIGWWDAAFTRLLLECIPGGPADLVDIYCRTGLSALTVLPERPQISWTGVDRKPARLEEARKRLSAQSAGTLSRITLREGRPHQLPIDNLSVDLALGIRALAHIDDTRTVFDEVWRILRPGGRFVMVEPDGLAETFYFEGPLSAYNAAFHALAVKADEALGRGSPAEGRPGLSIGPTLHRRMAHAGFEPGPTRVHATHNLKPRTFARVARRLRSYPTDLATASGLQESPLLSAVLGEVEALQSRIPEDAEGVGGHALPLFLVVGDKTEG